MKMEEITVRKYNSVDLESMRKIWNEVVEEGLAFPQENLLSPDDAVSFFAGQTFCAVAEGRESKNIYGLYILHPNNVGRCSHIANASYAVSLKNRGLHIGEALVKHSLLQSHKEDFKILQFNAVVASNIHARHLYERLGFIQLGTIKGGFRSKDGHYEDICPYYHQV